MASRWIFALLLTTVSNVMRNWHQQYNLHTYSKHFFMPTNSQKKADYKKERCGNLLLYPTDRLLAFAFGTDKTIAHTKGYVKSQLWLYTPMMWYYCYHLRSISNFARICQMKIISITPLHSTAELLCKGRKVFQIISIC